MRSLNRFNLAPERLNYEVVDPKFKHIGYSMRRYYVDEFHFRCIPKISKGNLVLDLGGNKILKRGQFDIELHDLHVIYLNLSNTKCPDVLSDAVHAPFKDDCFDTVICSELLEHVENPSAILKEVYRYLRKEGNLLICVPFLTPIHADPYDYGRYTSLYWLKLLMAIGFNIIHLESQGLFFSVLVDMLRGYIHQMMKEGRPRSNFLRRLLVRLVGIGKRRALKQERKASSQEYSYITKYATGYGIIAEKSTQSLEHSNV